MNCDKGMTLRSSRLGEVIAPRRAEHKDATYHHKISRRGFVARTAATASVAGLLQTDRVAGSKSKALGLDRPQESIKITRLETFILKNSWVFVKISVNAGIVGWGEMLKDKSKTCAAGAKQVEPYFIGRAILSDFNRIRKTTGSK